MNMTQRRKVADLITRKVDKFKHTQRIVYQNLLKREREVFDAKPPADVAKAVRAINQAVETILKSNIALEVFGYAHKDNLGYNFEHELLVKILSRNRPESKIDEPNFDRLDEKVESLEMKLWISGDLEAEALMTELEGLLK